MISERIKSSALYLRLSFEPRDLTEHVNRNAVIEVACPMPISTGLNVCYWHVQYFVWTNKEPPWVELKCCFSVFADFKWKVQPPERNSKTTWKRFVPFCKTLSSKLTKNSGNNKKYLFRYAISPVGYPTPGGGQFENTGLSFIKGDIPQS